MDEFIFDGMPSEELFESKFTATVKTKLDNFPAKINDKFQYISSFKLGQLTGFSEGYIKKSRPDEVLSDYTFIANKKRWWGNKEAVAAWHKAQTE